MKKILMVLVVLLLLTDIAFAAPMDAYETRDKGVYYDGRNQVIECHKISPPNEVIPVPKEQKTVLGHDIYYDVNKVGLRRGPVMQEWIPNYNRFYSNRRYYPYSRQDFINVWATGQKNYKGVDVVTEEYAVTFVRAENWPFGVIKAVMKAKKVHRKVAVFLMVNDLGFDSDYMREAKAWSKQFNVPMFFGTIDAYIPQEWIPDMKAVPCGY